MQSKLVKAVNKTVVEESNISKDEACIRLRTVAATDMTHEPFSSFEFDGVLGLGLPGLSQTPEFNFFNVATLSGAVQTNMSHLFAVFLATSELEQSDITFGGLRVEHIADGNPQELGWCDVVRPELGYWQLQIHAIIAGDTVLPYCQDGSCRAVVDTGTSLLGVPSDVGSIMRSALQHPQGPMGGCRGSGPDLHFDLGNFTVTLRPEDYARPDISDDSDQEVSGSPSDCVPMLMLMDLPEPLGPKLFILGEPVLQRYYTGFDSKNHRVGFALAKHATPPVVNSDDLVTV
jgi:cathepsin D